MENLERCLDRIEINQTLFYAKLNQVSEVAMNALEKLMEDRFKQKRMDDEMGALGQLLENLRPFLS